ncbi:phosphatase PAP2 family protein [Halogranum rubrum]|uniref:Phosphatidic acid phosphatase type 2/haloperoxidase domain-containing protein n=1 Tax=Halogranum salarium B-1 TaxID=1210908 RepID=J3JHS7_9EURY|nr:phosphatase PAP2 family protein [Halogranum salarium]EJN61259.1 hypothetical protein HSB1_03000 [Halogranum salarium B-1]
MSQRERFDSDSVDWTQQHWKAVVGLATTVFALLVALVLVFEIAVPERGLGLLEGLSVQFGSVLTLAGLVTQVGDPWFLLMAATLVYLLGVERSLVAGLRDGAFVLGVTFSAFSLTDLLKNFFVAPRPPGASTATVPEWLPTALGGAFKSITTGTGYAFPSGHALGTTAVVAALAYTLNVGSRTSRWVAGSVVVVLVTASRVVLGVHFFVDIVAGVVAGLSLFAVAASVGNREPLRVFALGVVLGLLAVVASAMSPAGEVWKAGQWLGASLGAGTAWYVARPSRTLDLRGTILAGVPIAALWIGIYVMEPPLVVTVVGTALAAATTIATPTLVARLRGFKSSS